MDANAKIAPGLTRNSASGSSAARRRHWHWSHSYWAATTFVAFATLVRLLLDPLFGDAYPFLTYFAAIAAAGVVGGWRASALAVVLSYLLGAWCFVSPRHAISFQNGASDYAVLAVFLF